MEEITLLVISSVTAVMLYWLVAVEKGEASRQSNSYMLEQIHARMYLSCSKTRKTNEWQEVVVVA